MNAFEGLFDKLSDTAYTAHEDVLLPIKKEVERFFSSRQKSVGKNKTNIASDYGVPEDIWEPGHMNLGYLETVLATRLSIFDTRLYDVTCQLSYQKSSIDVKIAFTVKIPDRHQQTVHFIHYLK